MSVEESNPVKIVDVANCETAIYLPECLKHVQSLLVRRKEVPMNEKRFLEIKDDELRQIEALLAEKVALTSGPNLPTQEQK